MRSGTDEAVAAVGAVIAGTRDSDSNNQGRDAARGAIVGGLAGAAVGATLDAQQRALQSQLATPGVTVVNTGSTLNVVLPEGVLVGVHTHAPRNERMTGGDTWLGSPPMHLPAREVVAGFAEHLTFAPSRWRKRWASTR